MRGPVTILHVSQPTDGGVGKYVSDLPPPTRSREAGACSSPAPPTTAWPSGSKRPARGTSRGRRVARRGRARSCDTMRLSRIVEREQPDARPPALVEGRARRTARDPRSAGRPSSSRTPGRSRRSAGPVRRGASALGAARGPLGDRDRLRQRGRAATGRGARHRTRNWRVIPNGVDLEAWPEASGEERSAAREPARARRAADGRLRRTALATEGSGHPAGSLAGDPRGHARRRSSCSSGTVPTRSRCGAAQGRACVFVGQARRRRRLARGR